MAKDCNGAIDMPVPTQKQEQAPQDPADRHGPGYDNDTPNNWLRGNGCKPGFDYSSKKGR